jgi:hypothetical protein
MATRYASKGLPAILALASTLVLLAPSFVSGCGSSANDSPDGGKIDAAALVEAGDGAIKYVTVVTGGGGSDTPSGSGTGSGSSDPLGDLPETGVGPSSGSSTAPDATMPSGDDGGVDSSSDAPTFNVCPNYQPLHCGTPCDLRSQTCCATLAPVFTCVDGTNTACGTNQASIHCQNSCDCPSGQSCCGMINTLVQAVESVCQPVLDGGKCQPAEQTNTQASAQLCTVTSECKDGSDCIKQTCYGGLVTLSVCGLQSQDPFQCMPTQ